MPISRRQHRIRQALWITCIVVILTVLVVIVSWISAGKAPAKDPARPAVAPVTTAQVDRPSFAPESPVPGRGGSLLHETNASPSPAPIQVEDLASPLETSPGSGPDSGILIESDTSHRPSPMPSTNPTIPSPEPKKPPPPAQSAPDAAKAAVGGFGVQVGAFGSEATAKEMKGRLERLGYRVALLPKGTLTRVVATGFADRPAALEAQEKLRTQGAPQAQVVSLD